MLAVTRSPLEVMPRPLELVEVEGEVPDRAACGHRRSSAPRVPPHSGSPPPSGGGPHTLLRTSGRNRPDRDRATTDATASPAPSTHGASALAADRNRSSCPPAITRP